MSVLPLIMFGILIRISSQQQLLQKFSFECPNLFCKIQHFFVRMNFAKKCKNYSKFPRNPQVLQLQQLYKKLCIFFAKIFTFVCLEIFAFYASKNAKKCEIFSEIFFSQKNVKFSRKNFPFSLETIIPKFSKYT